MYKSSNFVEQAEKELQSKSAQKLNGFNHVYYMNQNIKIADLSSYKQVSCFY